MMTKRQSALLTFLRDYIRDSGGVSPSFDEMKDALGLASKSGVHRFLRGLEERGLIRRLRHRARSVEVVAMRPQAMLALPAPETRALPAPVRDTARLVDDLVERMSRDHGFDDGDGVLICASPADFRATCAEVLGG